MKRKLMATVSVACLSGFILAAYAQEGATTSPGAVVGEVVSTTGGVDATLVIRGGEVFSLTPGSPLFEGDRIVTRVGGTLHIQTPGCLRDMSGSSTVVMNTGFCEATFASADAATLDAVSTAQAGAGAGAGAALPVLGGLLAAAGVAGVAGGGGGGGGDGPPPTSN